jgi:hypothetical protein
VDPQITILVPTRERCDVLGPCLKTLTAQDYGRLRIVVSDNASQDGTRDLVMSIADKRVSYLRTPGRMGMSEHWEWALGQIRSDWIGIVGDDDGLVPTCISRVAEIARGEQVGGIWVQRAVYRWPSARFPGSPASLTFRTSTGTRFFEAGERLRAALECRCPIGEVPMLYTGGWFRQSAIDAARGPDGLFYRSACPDLYSAVTLSRTTSECAEVLDPIAITGLSWHSHGMSAKRGEGNSEVTPASAFLRENAHPWHESMPLRRDGLISKNPLGLLLESVLQAEHLFPQDEVDWGCSIARMLEAGWASGVISDPMELEWTRRLAKRHGVCWPAAALRAGVSRLRHVVDPMNLASKLQARARLVAVSGHGMDDVHHAARYLANGGRKPLT